MRYLKHGFCCSFIIHIIFIGLVLLISHGFTEKAHTPTIDLSILASVNVAAGEGTDGFPQDMPSDEPSLDEIPPAEEYQGISSAPTVPENKTADREQRSEPAELEPETMPEEVPVEIPWVSSDAEETVEAYEDSLPDDVRPDDNKFTGRARDTATPVASHENVYQSFAGSGQLFQGIPADLNELKVLVEDSLKERKELWKLFVVLGLLFILSEIMLIRFWKT